MWMHRPWRALVPGTGDWSLAAYGRLCTAVEGNTTFYALPTTATVERWAEAAPGTLRFSFKVPREVSHDAGLRGPLPEMREFLARLAPLRDRLGPHFVQLPASFGPDRLGDLERFLRRLPADLAWSVEVRHPGYFAEPESSRLDDVLHRTGVERVILDSTALFSGPCETPDEIDTWRRKPHLPVRPAITGRHALIRFIGQNDPAANVPFWQPWARQAAEWLTSGQDVTFFAHSPDNVWSPVVAREFHHAVSRLVPDLAPLPSPGDAGQARLW